MTNYVVSTIPTDHISASLVCELGPGYELRNPHPHSKSRRFLVSGDETYVRLPSVVEIQEEPVHVVHSGYSRLPVNDGLEHLGQVLYAVNDPRIDNETRLERPSRIHLHMISFPYGKQDNVWELGEVNRARLLCEELLGLCDSMTVIAPHFQTREWSRKLISSGRVIYLSPYSMLCGEIARDYPDISEFKLVSPGKFARFEGVEVPLIHTSRVEGLDVKIDGDLRREDYEGKVVILIDDITLTGTTILRFGMALRQLNPKLLFLALPHIATQDALSILRGDVGYDAIYTTNTCDVFEPGDYDGNRIHIIDIS